MSDKIKPGDALLIDQIVRAVAELPDRTSPDDWPEAMLVTDAELRTILDEHLGGTMRGNTEKQMKPSDLIDNILRRHTSLSWDTRFRIANEIIEVLRN